jgi:ACS family D-galactonate transporter-like MFS transporter
MSLTGTVAQQERATRARIGVLGLISFATLLNYLDRAVMGVAAPSMTGELQISPEMMGLIFSAFSWTYAAAQIPGGIVLDRLGTRITYAASLVLWSVATLFHGLVNSVGMLFGFRLALGVAEAPCFPCNSRILSTWFPQDERARANSVYAVGQYAGLAFFSPVLFWIVGAYGWRALFVIAGAVGIVFGLAMYALYREPHQSRRANAAELEYIRAGGGFTTSAAAVSEPFSWTNVRRLMSQRQILGASIGQFCGNSTLVFFLTWFPTYLAEERGMDWIKSGAFAVLPYIAASVGVLLGGYFSDVLLRRTGSASVARKLPIVSGLLLASTIIAANYVDDNLLVIAIMSVAFFGQGMVNLGWTLISDIAPRQLIGLTGGVFNFCANLAGIITPIVIGIIVGQTGSFYGALAFIGALALIGAASYVFVIGDVKRIELR